MGLAPIVLGLRSSVRAGAETSVSKRVAPLASIEDLVWRESASLLCATTLAVTQKAKMATSKRGNSMRIFKGVT
jgi:hypothetical protein